MCEIRCDSCGTTQACDYVIATKMIGSICTPKDITCNNNSQLCPTMTSASWRQVTHLVQCGQYQHCTWDLNSFKGSSVGWRICDIKLTYYMEIGKHA